MTPALCATCPREPRPAAPSSFLCWQCREELNEALSEIGRRFADLDASPVARGLSGSRGAPGMESRPPLDVGVAALRDRRSSPSYGRQAVYAAPAVLEVWTGTVAEERGVRGPDGHADSLNAVRAGVAYLRRHLDWIVRQEWAPGMVADLRRTLSQLRAATGEPGPKVIGRCTATIDTTRVVSAMNPNHPLRVDEVPCGAPLYAPTEGVDIDCRRCGAHYSGAALIDLAVAQNLERNTDASVA